MGLFDKFRKKVRDAASEVDSKELSAEEGSEEAIAAISHQKEQIESTTPVAKIQTETFEEDEDDYTSPHTLNQTLVDLYDVLSFSKVVLRAIFAK